MNLIVYGDFNCPYSYLASLRVDELRRRGADDIEWRAVEHDPHLSLNGTPHAALKDDWDRELAEVRSLARPGERIPQAPPALIGNTRAAVAAYAEAVTDGITNELRRALFDAIWLERRHLSDAYHIRRLVAALVYPPTPIVDHLRAPDLPMRVATGRLDTLPERYFGATITPLGGPLTLAGQRRIDRWRAAWRATARVVPTVVARDHQVLRGRAALEHLAALLDGPAVVRAAEGAALAAAPVPAAASAASAAAPAGMPVGAAPQRITMPAAAEPVPAVTR